ncbi:hypothetical protein [Stenotrophomonas tuberculopleuritidis]|uniref:hypothetical protein n=1 Tax=Stenotrophomonas tuberculopleuritidis TaxID=3055079 RepID=UPI0026E52ADA|nr:hypothetical protein [Stenotrophomonas sp. 704A1]
MARQVIDTTTNHGSYTGDPAKVAFGKINDMTQELYTATAESSEVAYAETQAPFSASNVADVPGLSVTFVVPAKPMLVTFGGSVTNTTVGSVMTLVVNGEQRSQIVYQASGYLTLFREVRIGDLPVGSTATIKVRLASLNTSANASLFGGTGDRPYLGVRT